MTTTITKVFGPNPTIATVRTYLATLDLIGNDQTLDAYIDGTLVWNDSNPANPNVACTTVNRIRFLPVAGQNVNKLNTGVLDVTDSTPGAKIVFARDANRPFYPGYIFEDLILEYTGPESSQGMVFLNKNDAISGFDTIIRNCRFHNKSTGGGGVINVQGNHRILIENPLFVSDAGQAQFVGGFNGLSITNFTCVARGAALNTPKAFDIGYGQGPIRDGIFIGYNGPIVGRADASGGLPTNCFSNIAAVGTTGITTVSGTNALVQNESNNFLPAANSPAIGAGSAVLKRTTDIFGGYRGDVPDVGAAMRTAVAIPAPPIATITSVELRGQKRIVKGTYTGQADSGTFVLTPATTANGAAAANGTVVLSNGTFYASAYGLPGNYVADQVILSNPGGPGTCSGGAAFTIAVPAVPTITVTGMLQSGSSVVASGTYTGFPVSGLFTLTAATTPGGAVTQSAKAIVFNDDNTWTTTVLNVPYGSYGPSPATATNVTGTGTSNSPTITTYAPGNQPPGFPAVQLAPFTAPTFNSPTVAVGVQVAPVKLENTSASDMTNMPFTFGQVFKKGAFAPGNFLVGKVAGLADIPLQVNVRATHPDGSVRHAVISGILPSIAASAKVSMSMVRAASSTSTLTAVAPSAITAGGFTGSVEFTNLDAAGNTHIADLTAAINGGSTPETLLAGSIATEYRYHVIPTNTATQAPATDVEVYFHVRYYPTINKVKVDVVLERTKLFTIANDTQYTAKVKLNGAVVYTTPSPYVHYPYARLRKMFWTNNPTPLATLHDPDYLIDSKAVANYDRRVKIPESTIVAYMNKIANSTWEFTENGPGSFNLFMGDVGGRPDIGLLPGYAAATVLNPDKRLINYTLIHGERGGPWSIHYRDNSTGPGKGYPASMINFPYLSRLGNVSDCNNPNTGQNEHYPQFNSGTNLGPEEAHTPNLAYLPYLLTGDWFFLEEMQFWSCWTASVDNPYYRGFHEGHTTGQVRGQAWVLRGLAENAAFTPDTHYLKTHFHYWVKTNLALYNATFTDNPNANKLGIIDNNLVYNGGYGCGPWQDDYFTSAVGHMWELGFDEALRLLKWKARFPVGRMVDPDYCFNQAAPFNLRVRETTDTTVLYETLGECLNKMLNWGGDGWPTVMTAELLAAPCNSPERAALGGYHVGEVVGYAYGTEGYPSCLQPGLAMAVDSGGYEQYGPSYKVADSEDAWTLFDMRTVVPNYGTSPQFAIVPRTMNLEVIATPPGAPQFVIAEAHADGIALTAGYAPQNTGGSPIVKYTSYASTGQKQDSTSLSCTIPLPPGTTATVWMTATNENGVEGIPSPAIGPYTVPGGSSTPPTDTTSPVMNGVISTSNINTTGFTMSWQAATDNVAVASYEYSTNAGTVYSALGNVLNTVIAGLVPSTTYSLRVRAVDAAGNKSVPITGTVTTSALPVDSAPPVMSGSLAVSSITQTTATLTWATATDNTMVAGYERSVDGGGSYIDVGLVTSVNLVGLTAGTAYNVRVRAYDSAGNRATPILASFTTTAAADTTVPTMSGSLTVANVTQTAANLTWVAGTDNVAVTGYEYSIDGGATYTDAGLVLVKALTGLAPSTTYQARVRAYDAAGNKSNALSAQITTLAAVDTTAPVMVGTVSVGAISQTTLALSWQAATDNVAVAGYEYSLDGGIVYTSVGNTLGVTAVNLTPDVPYSIRVRAFDAAGNRSIPLSVSARTAANASSFTPSVARTVAVQPSAPNFVTGKFWTMVAGAPRGPKDPDSTIDITFDWSAWLADMGGSSIAKVKFTLQGVQDAGSYATGSKTTVFVSGGSVGTAAVSCRITTDSMPARVDERTVYLDLGEQ